MQDYIKIYEKWISSPKLDEKSKKELEDIEYYMLHYKDLHWKKIDLNGWDDKATAQAILKKCHEDYKKKFWK